MFRSVNMPKQALKVTMRLVSGLFAVFLMMLCACNGQGAIKASPTTTTTVAASPIPGKEPVGENLKLRGSNVNLRSSTEITDESNIICKLAFEQRVTGLEILGNFTHIYVPDTKVYGYVQTNLLIDENTQLYAKIPKSKKQKEDQSGNKVFEANGITPVMLTDNLVDVRLYAPDVKSNLVFATDNNVLGRRLYVKSVPLLQKDTALKLKKAAQLFAKDGYTIVLCDAYRPLSVQKILYDYVQDSNYVANPYTSASNHNRGAAVDITLCDANGVELLMPTAMHTFNSTANRGNPVWTQAQKDNVDYMTRIMKRAGFTSLSTEWWHFQDSQCAQYMTTDWDFTIIKMVTLAEM